MRRGEPAGTAPTTLSEAPYDFTVTATDDAGNAVSSDTSAVIDPVSPVIAQCVAEPC